MDESLVRYSKLSMITATNRFSIWTEDKQKRTERPWHLSLWDGRYFIGEISAQCSKYKEQLLLLRWHNAKNMKCQVYLFDRNTRLKHYKRYCSEESFNHTPVSVSYQEGAEEDEWDKVEIGEVRATAPLRVGRRYCWVCLTLLSP